MMAKVAFACAVGGLILGTAGLALGLRAHSDERTLQSQLATIRTEVARVSAKTAGQHRDLITCGDLQRLINDMPQSDSNGDTVFYGGPAGSIPLPAHCLNQ